MEKSYLLQYKMKIFSLYVSGKIFFNLSKYCSSLFR